MIELGLAADWIGKLAQELINKSKGREKEINSIADELYVDPDDLASMFVEPDLQPFSPADDVNEVVKNSFRVPCYKFIDGFISQKTGKDDGRRQQFVLADAGMGKTSILAMLKLGHATKFLLQEYRCVALKLGGDALNRLKEERNRNKTLLLLDAMDEDSEATGRIKDRIIEILKETSNFFRVIITCRTQYFPETEDDVFLRQDEVRIGGFRCPVIYISPFSDDQVDAYLNKKFSDEGKIEKAKKVLATIEDLKCRPMLLAYIDDLIDEKRNIENSYQAYRALVNEWLDRESRKDNSNLNRETLLAACQHLARYMTSEGIREISVEDLRKALDNREEFKSITLIDVGGRSLLNKNSDGHFRFAHKSFQEFLVVQTLQANQGWGNLPKSSQMMNVFIRRGTWSKKDLSGANLIGANLHDANLRAAFLIGAKLSDANLSDAKLSDANLSDAKLSDANLRRANLCNVDLSGADLRNADLRGADLRNANLCNAGLVGANLYGVDLSGADLRGAGYLIQAQLEQAKNWEHALTDLYPERTA